MGYNVKDLLNKAIDNAKKRKELYIKIKNQTENDIRMIIVSNILIKGTKKNIEFFNKLKFEAEDTILEKIDFATYDKISSLLNRFQKSVDNPNVSNIKDLLMFSLDIEEKTLALFVDIKGRFVQSEKDEETQVYRILSNIIEEKIKSVDELKKITNKYNY